MLHRLTCHDAYIRTVSSPGWDYMQPVCACGWVGHIHRDQYWANDEIDEHHTDITPDPGEQLALFEESSCSVDA